MDIASGSIKKRKQNTLTLAEKVKIIEDFEDGGVTHESLARKYGVGSSSVTRFLQHKNELRAKLYVYREHGIQNRRTMKEQHLPLMEQFLYVWMLQQREANINVTSNALRAKGQLLLLEIQKRGYYVEQNFAFSDGWIRRFKARFGLLHAVAGEKFSANVYLKFNDILMMKIVEMGLKKSQVYSADESVIFVRLSASRSVVLSSEEKASGRILNKIRYTFMPCCNADGSNKLKLMFIGSAAKPRSLPAIKLLPVSYYNSQKSWMTRDLFRTWFYREFVPAVRQFSNEFNLEPKALLVLDNCTAHYDGGDVLVSDDGLIRVIYIPPNATSECQPMDQAVIAAIKTRYKRKLMLKLVLEDEDLKFEDRLKNISLQQSIDWLATAWNEISASTIENSWKKLITQFPECEWSPVDAGESDIGDDVKALVTAVDALADTTTSGEEIEAWIVDHVYDDDKNSAWLTSAVLTDKEIVDSVLGENDSPIGNSYPDESANNTSIVTSSASVGEQQQEPKFAHAIQSLDCLIRFVQNDASEVSHLKSLRTKLIDDEWRKRAS